MAVTIRKSLLLGGIHALALVFFFVPLSWPLQMVPLIVWMVMSPVRVFAPIYAGLLAILVLLLGRLGMVLAMFSLLLLPAAAAMARQYRKQTNPFTAVVGGTLLLIGVMLLLFMALFAMQVDLVSIFEQSIRGNPALSIMFSTMPGEEPDLYPFVRSLIDMIPVFIIVYAAFQALLSHWLARKVLSRFWKPVPRMKRMKDWRLPRSLVWYYLLVLILRLMIPFEPGSTVSVILLNAMPLLTYALAIQGIGFLFFLADAKGWNRALPITAIVAAVLLAPVVPMIAWLGVMDLAFPFRERLKPNR